MALFFWSSGVITPHSKNVCTQLTITATPTTLSAGTLANMKYYVQHAAAAYCNSKPGRVGSKISCGNNACPAVAANSITNFAYLGSVPTPRQNLSLLTKHKIRSSTSRGVCWHRCRQPSYRRLVQGNKIFRKRHCRVSESSQNTS